MLDSGDHEVAVRFVREARVAGLLSHPNIVTVFDFFEESGTPYIAMEYLPRGSLRAWMKGLTVAQVGGVLDGVLAGLEHAEQRRVVHRDLKPPNLLVSEDGRIKIADFGIAKALDEMSEGTVTKTGGVVGTPGYMAPEQALGEEIGAWTDLYAVGVIAYQLMSGTRPTPSWRRAGPVDCTPVPVKAMNPAIPGPLSDWVDRLLIRDPALRTRSAKTAKDDLGALMSKLLDPAWRQRSLLDPESADEPASQQATSMRTGPATPPPPYLPERPMFPGSIDVPAGASTPPHGNRPRKRRWAFVPIAVAALAVLGSLTAAVVASGSGTDARFRTALTSVCRLAAAQQAARPRRTRSLNHALRQAKTWQESQGVVYYNVQQSLRDSDALLAALLELNPPPAQRERLYSAVGTLDATSVSYRAYLLHLNTAGSSRQLANVVAAFQAPDQVPVRVALIRLAGPHCLPPAPAPVKSAPLFSNAGPTTGAGRGNPSSNTTGGPIH